MDTSKIIIGTVGGGRYTVTAPIVKEDYGLYLKIEGLELPATYEVDFSNDEHNGTSVTMIGNADGVLIPRQFISSGKDVFAFLYHVGADFGRTVYKFRIPNKLRPDRTNEQPTPEEQSTIDQAISALNTAVEQTAQDVIDADASAQSASQSAENAHDSAVDAQNYAESAQTSATQASASASQASASATASAQSASQAEQIKSDVENMVDDAQASASASAQSATASANSASQASGYAQSASASAQSASGYASSAQTSAQTASTKASEASTSASTASAKATESAQSASQALTYKNDAEQAKTASQTAQGLAESARDSAISAKEDAEDARDEAQSIADGISGKVEQIDSNTERIESLEDDRYKPYVVDFASGSIASFSDGANDLPLKSLVVDINPVQDLHGYDSPWPAGGGEQLIPYPYSQTGTTTINGITFDVIADGDIAISGTASANAQIDLCTNNYNTMLKLPAGDYTISVNNTNVRAVVTIYDGDGHSTAEYSTPASRVFNIPNDGSDYRCRVLLRVLNSTAISGTAHIAIKLQNGSLATAWSPYENICPISGWTEVDVEQSGVNVWDEEWELGGINSANGANTNVVNAIRTKGFTRIKPLTSYCNYFGNTSSRINFQARFYDADKNYIGYVNASGTGIPKNTAFVTPSNAHYLRFQVQAEYGTTYNHDISINYPSTDHDYHPYTGRTIPISWQTEAGTVYGGKLDVLTGKLVIDMAMVDLGSLDWSTYSLASNCFKALLSDGKVTRTNYSADGICSSYAKADYITTLRDTDSTFGVGYSHLSSAVCHVAVHDSRFTDATAFKTAMSGVQLCYELATPIEIQLSANQINSLYGVNNILADSGDTEVEYRADTKLFIERLTAPDSADMIADANITSGKYFMVGNSLFKATANIANGAQIIVGTNCIRKSLSEALNEINA